MGPGGRAVGERPRVKGTAMTAVSIKRVVAARRRRAREQAERGQQRRREDAARGCPRRMVKTCGCRAHDLRTMMMMVMITMRTMRLRRVKDIGRAVRAC